MLRPADNDKKIALDMVAGVSNEAYIRVNQFTSKVFRTRGGRIGSGMGLVLEALWGYYVNEVLRNSKTANCELAWLTEHQYDDFACVATNLEWDPSTKGGEFFRIEAKSMNLGADESKAHFDVLIKQLDSYDHLLVLVWNWQPVDQYHFCPFVKDSFFGLAKPITELRDALHKARGGSFVSRDNCPDGCEPSVCPHHGEPLNAAGKRERLSGPKSLRPSEVVSYAANFGGLVRMLKTSTNESRRVLRKIRKENDTAHAFISFIHRNLPDEEANQYNALEWSKIAEALNIEVGTKSKAELQNAVRATGPSYMNLLRELP